MNPTLNAVGLAFAMFAACAPAQAERVEITGADQTMSGLTIYKDFGVVQDVRHARLPTGKVEVVFRHVAKTIEPTSVRVSSVGSEPHFAVEQQTYEHNLLNKQSLLQHFIGRKIAYTRLVREGDTEKRVTREGRLLAVDPQIVEFSDGVEIAPRGTISLPSIPAGLTLEPALVWRVDNDFKGRQLIRTSYLAGGLSWSADDRLDLDADETFGHLSVWASVSNESGVSYRNASVQLVAGDVKRVDVKREFMGAPVAHLMRMQSAEVTGKPFSDYYVFSLPGRVELADNATKQFRLISVRHIPVRKTYVLTTHIPERSTSGPLENWFDVRFSFDNLSKYGLGIALPGGIYRVFKSDKNHELQLLGEDRLTHKSKRDTVTVSVGKAFDLEAVHVQTAFRRIGERGAQISYRVTLHNRKRHKATVTLNEDFTGDWTILDQSMSGERVDSTTQRYTVNLAPAETRSMTYTVRIDR